MLGKTSITNRIIWILLAFFGWYMIVSSFVTLYQDKLQAQLFADPSPGMRFVLDYYALTLSSVVVFILVCLLIKKNRFMLDIIKPTAKRRSMSKLGVGILLGFLTNFFCILCALLHGDIKLFFDFSASQIPLMIFAFICVFIQSSSEELWCRTFMYERINVHYPLWVAIVVNGVVFGLLHSANPGITALAMVDLIVCGLAYSLLRWYSGSIWTCFGIHTMWNFTQNLIFGLPNSGLVSEASIFHLDAMNAVSNWIYSYEFGVEGAIPAIFIDLLLAAVILYKAKKDGRLGELLESRESRGEMPAYEPKGRVSNPNPVEIETTVGSEPAPAENIAPAGSVMADERTERSAAEKDPTIVEFD